MLLNGNEDLIVVHALKVNGKIVFKNSNRSLVENYRENNLTDELKEKAVIEMITNQGKQVLLG